MNECPNGCNLQGAEIPEAIRHHYGGKTHYSRVLGVEIPEIYDGVLYYVCPFCSIKWPRFAEGKRHEQAMEIINNIDNFKHCEHCVDDPAESVALRFGHPAPCHLCEEKQ